MKVHDKCMGYQCPWCPYVANSSGDCGKHIGRIHKKTATKRLVWKKIKIENHDFEWRYEIPTDNFKDKV